MNKKIIYIIISVVIALSSCSDWTDTESLDINSPEVEHQNPALYKKYLENLNKYKESDHKVIYAWLDNSSKVPTSHSSHMYYLPDSIDYIALESPCNLADWELKEMDAVRKKGTKVLSQFNFDILKTEYDTKIAAMVEEGLDISNEPLFLDVLIEKISSDLASTDQYNFDGLLFAYNGKGITYMTEKEKAEYLQYHNVTTRLVSIWKENNPNKILTFSGKPQNILDKSLFDICKHIIISTHTAKNFSAVTYEVSKSIAEGMPTDRFVVTSEAPSLDPDDNKTGYWSNGDFTLIGVSEWINSSHSGFSVVGMGMYGVSNDYFNPNLTFPITRKAIQILNPSLKTE